MPLGEEVIRKPPVTLLQKLSREQNPPVSAVPSSTFRPIFAPFLRRDNTKTRFPDKLLFPLFSNFIPGV